MKNQKIQIIVFLAILFCLGNITDLQAQQFEIQYEIEDWRYKTDNTGVWGCEYYNNELYFTRVNASRFRSYDKYTGIKSQTLNVNYNPSMDVSGYQDTMYMAMAEPSTAGYARIAKLYMPDVVGSTPVQLEITDFPMNSAPVCLAYDTDNDALWANYGTGTIDAYYEGSSSDIYQLDLNGNIINTIPAATHGLTDMTGFAYYNDGTNPYLWITQFDGRLNKFDLTTNTVVFTKDMSYIADPRGLFQGLKSVFVAEDAIENGETTLGLYGYLNRIVYYNIETLEYINADAGVTDVNLRTADVVSNNFVFEGTIKNYGEESLSSSTVEITADGAVIASETFNFTTLNQFETYDFTFSSPYDNSALYSTSAELVVKTTMPNGQPLDDDNTNDGVTKSVGFGNDVFPHKKVLLEVCMPDPSASWYDYGFSQMEAIIGYPGYDGDYTVANLQRGAGSFGVHGIIATTPIIEAFSGGWPNMGIDRSRSLWTHYSTYIGIPQGSQNGAAYIPSMDIAKEQYTPFEISIDGDRAADGSSINVTVDVFTANAAISDDYRISIFVTEDDVENDGNSRMDNTVRLVFPVENDGFDDLYSWGVQNVIPNNPTIGETYSHTFENIAIDPSWKLEDLKIVALVHTHDDELDNDKRVISNSEDGLVSDFSVITSTNDLSINDNFLIYPNPASNQVTIKTNTPQEINLIDIIDVFGRTVKTIGVNRNTTLVNVDVSDITTGTYLIRINTNENSIDKTVIIM